MKKGSAPCAKERGELLHADMVSVPTASIGGGKLASSTTTADSISICLYTPRTPDLRRY